MDDTNGSLTLEIGKLIGQVQALHSRFNGVDVSISGMRQEVSDRVEAHEKREDVRLATIDAAILAISIQLETVKRLVWLGLGGFTVVVSAVELIAKFWR